MAIIMVFSNSMNNGRINHHSLLPKKNDQFQIYGIQHKLIAYKFQYQGSYNVFYSYPSSVNSDIPDDSNDNAELLIIHNLLRQMTIKKFELSFKVEYSQRKPESEIILNAYRLICRKNNCYMLPINNNNYEIIDSFHFNKKTQICNNIRKILKYQII